MSKRILVAEASDTVRGVAETILRQNGYEVLSVPSAQKLLEVLEFSLPDMMLISADLRTEDGRACYDPIQDNPRTSSIPLLILAGNESQYLPFPPEVVIPRPFDPRDLIQRVQVFSGQSEPKPKTEGDHPLGDATLDDDLLDAALGLDRIDVTESEVLDKTGHIVRKAAAKAEKATDMAQYDSDDDEESRSGKVESLMIRDEHSEIAQKHSVEAKKKPVSPGTSKLEIMDDQYGLSDPGAFKMENENQDHDYDWFVQSMREENLGGGEAPSPPQPKPAAQDSSGELTFTDPSAHVDPITPGPGTQKKTGKTSPTPPMPGTSHTAGVDKFIDEFKKEIEKIRSTEPENVAVETRTQTAQGDGLAWEDKVERLSPEHVELFKRELITVLAEKIAEQISAKIDSEKLLQLIKTEIIAHLRKK